MSDGKLIEIFLKNHTLFHCERHGWVAAKFGKIPPTGREVPSGYAKMCKGTKYFIKHCCGVECTNKEPKSMMEVAGVIFNE